MAFNIILSIVILLYFIVAFFAFFATISEQQHNGIRTFWPRAMSAVACLIWPLTAGVMFLIQKITFRH